MARPHASASLAIPRAAVHEKALEKDEIEPALELAADLVQATRLAARRKAGREARSSRSRLAAELGRPALIPVIRLLPSLAILRRAYRAA